MPNWDKSKFMHPRAVKLTRGSSVFVLPNNPTGYTSTPDTIAANRRSLDGNVTYVWGPDVVHYTLEGLTEKEGLDTIKALRDECQGQADVNYSNALDGSAANVLVKQVVWVQDGQRPYTWRYTIQLQSAGRFTAPTI